MASTPEALRMLARVRSMLAQGYSLSVIGEQVGKTKQHVWKIKKGLKHGKTSIPLNELEIRKPRHKGIMCRRCGESQRLFAKSGLCIVCELFELAKLGAVVIHEAGDVE